MPKEKEARVYEVVHSGVGAIADKGPWKKGNHLLRDHYEAHELPHLERLIKTGAVKPVEYKELEDLEEALASREMTVADIPKNPWADCGNVNNDYAKITADIEAAKRAAEQPAASGPKPARGHREVTEQA